MSPNDLPSREIQLTDNKNAKIVILTGTSLRHDRFALLIQKEFGNKVVGWFRCIPEPKKNERFKTNNNFKLIKKLARNPSKIFKIPNIINKIIKSKTIPKSLNKAESELFAEEVTELRKNAHIKPELIVNPNRPDFVNRINSIKPYLILTLGGIIYSNALIKTAQGLPLNQHDGWCPEFKGTRATDWTLYHRKVSKIGNTIHLLCSGMDSGPILRRSSVCLVPEDSLNSCFFRSVALGTDLMVECVHSILSSKTLLVYDQKPMEGYTYINSHYNYQIQRAIERDIKDGVIANEIKIQTNF